MIKSEAFGNNGLIFPFTTGLVKTVSKRGADDVEVIMLMKDLFVVKGRCRHSVWSLTTTIEEAVVCIMMNRSVKFPKCLT